MTARRPRTLPSDPDFLLALMSEIGDESESDDEFDGWGSLSQSTFDTGYSLTFCFVCAYGTLTTFGKDNGVFYDK